MLANRQNDEPVPNRVASSSEPINPRPNAVIGRGSRTRSKETFWEVGGVKDETDKIGYK